MLFAETLSSTLETVPAWYGWFTVGVVVAAFVLAAATQYATDMIFLGGLVLLMLSGVLSAEDALAGFSNPGLITVGVLYVVVAGVRGTGGIHWISHRVLGTPRTLRPALARLTAPVMGLSAFLNNTPVVAMFIPAVEDWSRKLRISPSRLLIPLSYASIFGGICTLIGTSTSLVVNGMLLKLPGEQGLGMFDITLVGLPCALVGFVYLLIAGPWLLPERKPVFSEDKDPREYTVRMIVEESSPLVGQTIRQAGLRHLPGLYIVEIERADRVMPAVGPVERLQANDVLIFAGAVDSVVDLQKFRGLSPAGDQITKLGAPRSERCLFEAVVSDSCPLVGRSIRVGRFRGRYNAVVLAVARNGQRIKGKIGDIVLRQGDSLMLEADPSFLDSQRLSRDFYLVSEIPDSQPIRHEKAPAAAAILTGMVLLVVIGRLTMLNAAMAAAVLMILFRCCSVERARRSIEWSVLLVIAATLGLGRALEQTGVAASIAGGCISLVGDNPWLALAVIYVVTMLLTEFITNIGAAVLVFPIAVATAAGLNVSILPFAITIMIAASASFITPIGYQTNLMVYNPGGYHFSDFARVGLPLSLLFGIITVAITPVAFPF